MSPHEFTQYALVTRGIFGSPLGPPQCAAFERPLEQARRQNAAPAANAKRRSVMDSSAEIENDASGITLIMIEFRIVLMGYVAAILGLFRHEGRTLANSPLEQSVAPTLQGDLHTTAEKDTDPWANF